MKSFSHCARKEQRLRLNLEQQQVASSQLADTAQHDGIVAAKPVFKPLTPMRQAFALELAKGSHKTDAYISSFDYKGGRKKAENAARRLAKRADIQNFVAILRAGTTQPADLHGVTVDSITLGLAQIAFSDIRKLFNSDGEILPIEQWPTDAALAVSSYQEEVSPTGMRLKRKIKLWDKPSALKMLAEIKAMLHGKPDATQRAHFVFHLGAPVKGSKRVKGVVVEAEAVKSVDNSAPFALALPASAAAPRPRDADRLDDEQR